MSIDMYAIGQEVADGWRNGTIEGSLAQVVATVLTKHLADAPRTVVEVTGQELWSTRWPHGSPWQALSADTQAAEDASADRLNKILRARAGTVALQWVERPVTTKSGALVVPEDGVYASKDVEGRIEIYPERWDKGDEISESCTAIRRIDTDEPTTWIERTPETVSAWTAEVCEQFVGKLCTVEYGGVMRTWHNGSDNAADIAQHYNEISATAVCILPDRPAGAGA